MWRFHFLLLVIPAIFAGCETDPFISIPSKPVPVIYAVMDDLDSIHKIYVTKSFGAPYDPSISAQVYDSLFFKDLELKVEYLPPGLRSSWTACEVNRIGGLHKDSGFFQSPTNEYFEFGLVLREWPVRYVDSIRITAQIPGYQDVFGQLKLTDSIMINTPKFNQQFITLTPKSSLKVQWSNAEPWEDPHAWTEIDVAFEFIEKFESGKQSKWVHIQNTQYYLSPHDLYRELSITYEEFIREVLQQIPSDESIQETSFGYIRIHITGGDDHMVQYMKYFEGFNDYDFNPYSNIHNGYGLLTSATHFFKDSMHFDFETRQTLINENRLKKLKISPWSFE